MADKPDWCIGNWRGWWFDQLHLQRISITRVTHDISYELSTSIPTRPASTDLLLPCSVSYLEHEYLLDRSAKQPSTAPTTAQPRDSSPWVPKERPSPARSTAGSETRGAHMSCSTPNSARLSNKRGRRKAVVPLRKTRSFSRWSFTTIRSTSPIVCICTSGHLFEG